MLVYLYIYIITNHKLFINYFVSIFCYVRDNEQMLVHSFKFCAYAVKFF